MFRSFRVGPRWGDLAGGLTAGLITLPSAVAYGALALAPLGPGFTAAGVAAGLMGLVVLNLLSAPLASVPFVQSGPILLASLTIASSLPVLMNLGQPVWPLLLLLLFSSGVLQILFGLLRGGDLLKYIPHPVVAGLINGTLVSIALRQWRPVLGFSDQGGMALAASLEPLTLTIALVTMAVYLIGVRTRKYPPALTALLIGALVYHLIAHSGLPAALSAIHVNAHLGPLLGALPPLDFSGVSAKSLGSVVGRLDAWVVVLPMALGLAAITSLHSLVNLVSVDSLGTFKNNTNREILAQGLGNSGSALLGGLTGAVLFQRTQACYEAGGRTIYSRVCNGLLMLVLVVFAGKYLGLLPKVTVSAFLLVFCVSAVDPWSVSQVKRLLNGNLRGSGLFDLGIMLAVVGTLVFFGIFTALVVGVGLAIVMVLLDSSKQIIRERAKGDMLRSNVERPVHEVKRLREEGSKIEIAFLEGMLFFATSDRLRRLGEEVLYGPARVLILDGRRISKIDATGALVLAQLATRLEQVGKSLMVAGLKEVPDEIAACRALHLDPSLNGALSRAEDAILGEGRGNIPPEITLKEVDALARLRPGDLRILERHVKRREFVKGSVIFRRGAPGDAVYFVVRGRAEVYLNAGRKGNLGERLSEICAGTAFGEMAVLDGSARTASLVAGDSLVVYELTRNALETLSRRHGKTALLVTRGLALEISKRLRVANGMLGETRK